MSFNQAPKEPDVETLAALKKKVPTDETRSAESVFRHAKLIHGHFTSLEDKLKLVSTWPEVTKKDIKKALKEARARIERFKQESPNNPLLNIVICKYLDTPLQTLAYCLARVRRTFPQSYISPAETSIQWATADDIQYLSGAPVHQNCLRIEVVDLGVKQQKDRDTKFNFKSFNRTRAAHFPVFYSIAEDPSWFERVRYSYFPYVVVPGIKFRISARFKTFGCSLVEQGWNQFALVGMQRCCQIRLVNIEDSNYQNKAFAEVWD